MSTLDLVLTVLTILMFAFLIWVGTLMVKKGMAPKEVIMDLCSVLTFTFGENHKQTVAITLFVIVGMIAFNYFWAIPVYTTIWALSWVFGWALQMYVRLSTGTPFGNFGMWGIKAASVFMK